MSTIRDRVLSQKLKTQILQVDEWGAAVKIQEMTVSQRVDFATQWEKRRTHALVQVMIDNTFDVDSGLPVFEKADRDALINSGGKALTVVTDAIFGLSGMTEESAKDLEKNSQASAV